MDAVPPEDAPLVPGEKDTGAILARIEALEKASVEQPVPTPVETGGLLARIEELASEKNVALGGARVAAPARVDVEQLGQKAHGDVRLMINAALGRRGRVGRTGAWSILGQVAIEPPSSRHVCSLSLIHI